MFRSIATVAAGVSLLSLGGAQLRHPFDASLPLNQPVLFGEGVISTPDYDLNTAFTPDGKTLYFTKSTGSFTSWTIVVSHFRDGRWTEPEVAEFSGRYSDADPFISPDGKQLFFISNRPVNGKPKTDYDIWVMDRGQNGWGEPRNLGAPVNSEGPDYYPAVTANGTLYFSSVRRGGKGSMDLYRSRLVDGKYSEIENLGDTINTQFSEVDAVVAPDESFVIFSGFGRPDDPGGRGDLYISYRKEGQWTPARNLGPAINTASRDFCPALSPDGKYMFFSSERGFAESRPPRRVSYRELLTRLRGIHNGLGNIYQVDMAVVKASAPE